MYAPVAEPARRYGLYQDAASEAISLITSIGSYFLHGMLYAPTALLGRVRRAFRPYRNRRSVAAPWPAQRFARSCAAAGSDVNLMHSSVLQ
jgi:hypothetical protein